MRRLLLAVAVAVLAGCGSTPEPVTRAPVVPEVLCWTWPLRGEWQPDATCAAHGGYRATWCRQTPARAIGCLNSDLLAEQAANEAAR